MKETTLWGHLRPELARVGKFQKISDRFTPGIPDVLGCRNGIGVAIELKELSGVVTLRTKFRPGQLDWLRDWEKEGGDAWIISSWRKYVFVHRWTCGHVLEDGAGSEEVMRLAVLVFQKTRDNTWREFISQLPHRPSSQRKIVKRIVSASPRSS